MADEMLTGFLAGQADNGRNNSGFMGGDGWWAIILFAMIFGWGNGGWGNGGNAGAAAAGAPWATQADVRAAVDQQTLISKLDQQTYGLADSTYALNNTLNSNFHGVDNAVCTLGYNVQSGFNTLAHQLSDCCSTTQRAIDGVNYNMAKGFCDIGNAMANSTRDINDTIRDGFARMEAQSNARYIADLERRLNSCDRDSALQGLGTYLINTLRPTPIPAYQSCNPWAGNNGSCCGY